MLEPSGICRISDAPGHHAARTPAAEALVHGDRRIDWAGLDALVDRCARALLAAGVRRGDRVAMLATPRPEYLVTFLAAGRIGAIWLGLNPKYRLDELRYVVGDSAPSLLLGMARTGERDHRDDLAALESEHAAILRTVVLGASATDGERGGDDSTWADFLGFVGGGDTVGEATFASTVAAVEPMDPVLLVYTSGSTGRPKGALLTHHGLTHCSKVQWERWRTSRPPRILCNFPINHVAATGDICSYALVAGGAVVFQEAFDPAASLEAIERERLTVWGGVPTMLQLCLAEAAFERTDFSSLELILWGGAAAPRSLLERLSKLGGRLATSYGMTETTGSVTYTDEDADLDTLAETIGRPDPRYQVRLARPDGRPCAPGEEGEIQVRGDFVMRGYLNRPEATAGAIDAEGWLHTGDVALERPDGNWRIVGRLSQMYKSGGYNVYPREVELALEDHPAVAMAAVVPVPDPLYQEVGHAFVLAEPGAGVDEPELRGFLAERLANYKIPKRFHLRRELPMLPVGKIDRVRLTEEAGRLLAGG